MISNYTDEELVKILRVAACHWNAKDQEKAVYEQCALRIDQLAKEVEGLKLPSEEDKGSKYVERLLKRIGELEHQLSLVTDERDKLSREHCDAWERLIASDRALEKVTAERDALREQLKAKV